jgi:Flp pilus assembly protein TadD
MVDWILSKLRCPRSLLLGCAIVFAVVITFARVSTLDFVSYDDDIHVYQNVYFQPLKLANLSHFWTHFYYALYVPVAYMAFALTSLIARTSPTGPQVSEFNCGLNPHVFHEVNLLLHVVNAILVFVLIRKLVRSETPAALGALLFALHPLQVESLAWVSELRGLLGACFGLASMILYLHAENVGRRFRVLDLPALLLFVLSLLSKPDVVVVPVVLLTWTTWVERGEWRQNLVRLSPWFVLSVADTMLTRLAQPAGGVIAMRLAQRVIIALDSLGFYIEKLIWPFNFVIDYGRTPQYVLAGRHEVVTIFVVTATVLICAAIARRRTWVIPCALTFFFFLLPVTGLIPFTFQSISTVADRYAYLALLGPACAVSFLLAEIRQVRTRRLAQALALVGICYLGVSSSRHVGVWKNTATLFAPATITDPNGWLPYDELCSEYLRRGEYDAADKEGVILVHLMPKSPIFWLKLGQAVQGQGRYETAESDYATALSLAQNSPLALFGRAQCEEALGDRVRALADYRATVRLFPPGTVADYRLADELYLAGDYSQAIAEYGIVLRFNPGFIPAYRGLAAAYSKIGDYRLANDETRIAVARSLRIPRPGPAMQVN